MDGDHRGTVALENGYVVEGAVVTHEVGPVGRNRNHSAVFYRIFALFDGRYAVVELFGMNIGKES